MTLFNLPRSSLLISRSLVAVFISALVASLLLIPGEADGNNDDNAESPVAFLRYDAPAILSYAEIASIDSPSGVSAALKPKLDALMVTPFTSNEAYLSGATRELDRSDKLGQFIRVGFWNIQRGLRLDEIKLAIENPDQFKQQIKADPSSEKYREIAEQVEVFRSVDVLALNEADLGLKRTGYRDVARELAAALKMNYVYGVEFIEIDPLNLGSAPFSQAASGETRVALKWDPLESTCRHASLSIL